MEIHLGQFLGGLVAGIVLCLFVARHRIDKKQLGCEYLLSRVGSLRAHIQVYTASQLSRKAQTELAFEIMSTVVESAKAMVPTTLSLRAVEIINEYNEASDNDLTSEIITKIIDDEMLSYLQFKKGRDADKIIASLKTVKQDINSVKDHVL